MKLTAFLNSHPFRLANGSFIILVLGGLPLCVAVSERAMKALGRKQNMAPMREFRKKPCIALIPCMPELTADGVSGLLSSGVSKDDRKGMKGEGRETLHFTGFEGIGMFDHSSITGATEKFPRSGTTVGLSTRF